MYNLDSYDSNLKTEWKEKIHEFNKKYPDIPHSELLEIFYKLLNYFNEDRIYHPYLTYEEQYQFNMISFVTNTLDEIYEEKKNKLKDFDFDISFQHYIEQYEIKFSRNSEKEYINIIINTSDRVFINNYQNYSFDEDEDDLEDKMIKNFSSNDKKLFELIIYSMDKMFIKMKNNKIIPLHLSNIYYYPDDIFKILFEIYSDYNPIYKDILREINNHIDFLHIDFTLINSCHTKKDILENIFKIKLYNSINKYSLAEGYTICCALKLVEPKDYFKIYEFASIQKDKDNFKTIYSYMRQTSKNEMGIVFIENYIANKIATINNMAPDTFMTKIKDFIRFQHKELGIIDLNNTNKKKIEEYAFNYTIDKLAKKQKSFKITKNNNFNELELPKGFERIKSKKELIEICKKTKINVFLLINTYYSKISCDSYALYNVQINKHDYIIVVKMTKKYNSVNNKNYKYSLIRILTKDNKRVPFEFYEDMHDIINKYNNKNKLGGIINEL